MPRTALRLLLALCLVLNGVGNAMAAAAMPAVMAQAGIELPDAPPQAVGSCGHADGDASNDGTAPIEHAVTHPAACEQDGCDQGDCSCPCMQLVQAALFDLPVISASVARSGLVAPFPGGHLTPLPLHPMRPPIG